MTPDPITIDARASIGDAIAAVSEHGVRHLPIVEDGALVGVLSDRDLRRVEGLLAVDAEDAALVERRLAVPAATLLQGAAVTVPLDASLAAIIDRMLEAHVGAVVVVGPGKRVCGIVSYVDVLRVARSACPLVERSARTGSAQAPRKVAAKKRKKKKNERAAAVSPPKKRARAAAPRRRTR